jgi:hypothetical protein
LYLNSPPPPFSFFSSLNSWENFNRSHFLNLHTCVHNKSVVESMFTLAGMGLWEYLSCFLHCHWRREKWNTKWEEFWKEKTSKFRRENSND